MSPRFDMRRVCWPTGTEPGMWLSNRPYGSVFEYQENTGVTPSAINDPVGLWLDRRLGLVPGTNLITNGSNLVATTDWTAELGGTLAAVGGLLQVTNTATNGRARQTITGLVVGKAYLASAYIDRGTSAIGTLQIGASVWVDNTGAAGVKQFVYFTTATSVDVICQCSSVVNGQLSSFGNISFTLLDGNHISQATAAARMILTGGVPISNLSDGLDDIAATATQSAGVIGNPSMLAMFLVKRAAATGMRAGFQAAASANYFGSALSGGAGAANVNSGAAVTTWVDGVQVPGGAATTEAQLHTALTVGAWHVLEFHNLDLSAYTALAQGFYDATYTGNNNIAEIVTCPQLSDTGCAKVRRDLGRLAGLAL